MATESMTRDGRRATLLAALAITVHVTGLLLPLHYQGFIGFGPIIPWQSGRPPSFTVGVLIAGLITVVVVAVGLWLLFRSQLSAAGGVFLAAAINELAGAVHAPLVVPGIQPFVRGGLRLVEGSLLLAAT